MRKTYKMNPEASGNKHIPIEFFCLLHKPTFLIVTTDSRNGLCSFRIPMSWISGNILERQETRLQWDFIRRCNGGGVTKEWNSAHGTEIMTTTKATVRRKISRAGGLTGLPSYKHRCNGVDGISLLGINYICMRSCWSSL